MKTYTEFVEEVTARGLGAQARGVFDKAVQSAQKWGSANLPRIKQQNIERARKRDETLLKLGGRAVEFGKGFMSGK